MAIRKVTCIDCKNTGYVYAGEGLGLEMRRRCHCNPETTKEKSTGDLHRKILTDPKYKNVELLNT